MQLLSFQMIALPRLIIKKILRVALSKKCKSSYSLSPGFWQSFISVEVCRDCILALASSCKKQLTGFFVCLFNAPF